MKNYLTLVLALAVVSSPAYASRARLESLGEGKNGSYYIDDGRNMFLNPASIAKNKKKLFLELGGEQTVSDQDAAGTDASTSRAQGGFTNTFGDFTYAVYLNNVSDRAINTLGSILAPANSIEVALAGEGTVNWGLSLLTGGNRSNVNTNSYYWAARFGVEKDAAALFGTVGFASKATSGAAEIKGNLSLDLGATYKIDNMTLFGRYTSTKATANATFMTAASFGAITTANESQLTAYGVGAGWKKEMTKSTNMFTRIEAASTKVTNSTALTTGLTNIFNVPLVLGAETQALSWLAIRGSIAQSLTGSNLRTNSNYLNNPTVAAGVGMTFGDVQIDGVVASSASNGQVDNTGFGTGTNSGSDFGFGDNMITRIGLTYNF
jgi:hypothetical protein